MSLYTTPLDVTPQQTMNSVQFDNEILNSFLSSIIITFILANLNSSIHKFINISKNDHFNYEAYVRAYIFNASDDALSILRWIFRHNTLTEKKWPRRRSTVKWTRLFLPALARTVIFVASIGSIAMAIPSEKIFSKCEGGEYEAVLTDPVTRPAVWRTNSLCTDLGVDTSLGKTSSRLSLCARTLAKFERSLLSFREVKKELVNAMELEYDREYARVTTFFTSKGLQRGIQFYTEWTPTGSDKLRSLYPDFNESLHTAIALRAVKSQSGNSECDLQGLPVKEFKHKLRWNIACPFNVTTASTEVDGLFRSGLMWRKSYNRITRVRMLTTTTQTSIVSETVTDCPYSVTTSAPAINIIPLLMFLVFAHTLNIAVRLSLKAYGDVDDASFHLIKEAFSLDATLNPIQVNKEARGGFMGEHTTKLPFLKMHCDDNSTAHVGFLQSPLCTVVGELDVEHRVVSSCAHRG